MTTSINNDKIKIVKLPSFYEKHQLYSTELNCVLLPPLALGQIVSYLKKKGIDIEQDDLYIKVHYDNKYSDNPEEKIDESLFFDEERIVKYYQGDEDKYLDMNMEKVIKKSRFDGYKIILLSIDCNTMNKSNIMFTLSFVKFLKKKYHPVIIIGGSFGVAIDLLSTKYKSDNIDFLVKGAGEVVLFELLSILMAGQSLSKISRLHFSEDGKILQAEVKELVKPDFAGLPLEKYKYRGINFNCKEKVKEIIKDFNESGTLILPFKFIRGCPFECIFCCESGNKLTYVMSPQKVVSCLRELQEKYHPTGFFFLSDTLNISERYINELCDEIIKNKLDILWSDCARIDYFDQDTLFKMRRAGCIRLIYGMETASPRLLRYINKKVDVKRLEEILKWTDEAGIWTGLEIICGFPHEKEEDIDCTISFLNRNKKYINRIYYNVFDLRLGSKLFANPNLYGIEKIFDLSQYPLKQEFTYNRVYTHYGFDEHGGLSWQDKEKQMLYSYDKVIKDAGENTFPHFEEEHLLFFLYSRYDHKDEIKAIFSDIATQKSAYRDQLISPYLK